MLLCYARDDSYILGVFEYYTCLRMSLCIHLSENVLMHTQVNYRYNTYLFPYSFPSMKQWSKNINTTVFQLFEVTEWTVNEIKR